MTDTLSHSLESLLTHYAGLVERVGYRHSLTRAEVDEVFQDVRVRLWRSRRTSENILSTPGSYVYRTAVSAALALIDRRRGGASKFVELERESGSRELSVGDAAGRLDRADLRAQLERAVASLAESRRPVVRMYLAGYNHVEIAEVLSWSEAKVRNLLYRGLEDLRARLTEAGMKPGLTG